MMINGVIMDRKLMNKNIVVSVDGPVAAGKGTRMESELPKVLFPVLKRPVIDYVLDVLEAAGVSKTAVVVGYRSQDVIVALEPREDLVFVEQNQQLGTGHAVMMCRQVIADHVGPVLIVTGDSPLIQLRTQNTTY